MKWYKANMGNDHQGLIIDEETGANIAVTYDVKHAALVAAAPEILEALEELESAAFRIDSRHHAGMEVSGDEWSRLYHARNHAAAVITEAKGN